MDKFSGLALSRMAPFDVIESIEATKRAASRDADPQKSINAEAEWRALVGGRPGHGTWCDSLGPAVTDGA